VREAHEHRPSSRIRVAIAWRQVVAAREELSKLAYVLAQPGPVRPAGVAQALLLLTDGSGPMYHPRSPGTLRATATKAQMSLRPV
jgi:hypothetical protein